MKETKLKTLKSNPDVFALIEELTPKVSLLGARAFVQHKRSFSMNKLVKLFHKQLSTTTIVQDRQKVEDKLKDLKQLDIQGWNTLKKSNFLTRFLSSIRRAFGNFGFYIYNGFRTRHDLIKEIEKKIEALAYLTPIEPPSIPTTPTLAPADSPTPPLLSPEKEKDKPSKARSPAQNCTDVTVPLLAPSVDQEAINEPRTVLSNDSSPKIKPEEDLTPIVSISTSPLSMPTQSKRRTGRDPKTFNADRLDNYPNNFNAPPAHQLVARPADPLHNEFQMRTRPEDSPTPPLLSPEKEKDKPSKARSPAQNCTDVTVPLLAPSVDREAINEPITVLSNDSSPQIKPEEDLTPIVSISTSPLSMPTQSKRRTGRDPKTFNADRLDNYPNNFNAPPAHQLVARPADQLQNEFQRITPPDRHRTPPLLTNPNDSYRSIVSSLRSDSIPNPKTEVSKKQINPPATDPEKGPNPNLSPNLSLVRHLAVGHHLRRIWKPTQDPHIHHRMPAANVVQHMIDMNPRPLADNRVALIPPPPALPPQPLPLQKCTPPSTSAPSTANLTLQEVLRMPEFRIQVGKDLFEIHNPFGGLQNPTDDDVYKFRLNLSTVIELAQDPNHPGMPPQFLLGPDFSPLLLPSEKEKGKEKEAANNSNQIIDIIVDALVKASGQHEPSPPSDDLSLDTNQDTGPNPSLTTPPEVIVIGKISSFPVFLLSREDTPENRTRILQDREIGARHLVNLTAQEATVYNQPHTILQMVIRYCIDLSEADGKGDIALSDEQKKLIRIFFDKIKSTNVEKLCLNLFLKNKFKLQSILSPELGSLLTVDNPSDEQTFQINLKKAELATSFGFGIKPTGNGVNGAVFVQTLEEKTVGVVKTYQPIKWTELVRWAKYYVGQARLLSSEPGAQEYAEVVAADLAKQLNFNMAPKAREIQFCGKDGAFIDFLKGYKELQSIENSFKNRTNFTERELLLWQNMVVWNFLVGNLDPHSGNIFIKTNDQEEIVDLRMIDHGNCFPVSNPGLLGSKGNLGAWGNFSISKQPFHPEIIKFIKENITEEKILQFCYEKSNERRRKYFNIFVDIDPKQDKKNIVPSVRLTLERAKVLCEAVANGKIRTPGELANIKTDSDFKNFIKN